jgi:SAM-dependent methyltransferase
VASDRLVRSQSSDLVIADYDALAAEYYDVRRHPTCANFREGSRRVLDRWLGSLRVDGQVLCDIGAGKSILAEVVAPKFSWLRRVILVDESPRMLAYSGQWADIGAQLIIGDASRIPLLTESTDVIVSSLGDPYNLDDFWSEVRRVLRPGGRAFFTTPSYEWARAFRRSENGLPNVATFQLLNGQTVYVPSYILDVGDQVDLMARHGLIVSEVINVLLSALTETPISPKLLSPDRRDGKVVTGFALIARR